MHVVRIAQVQELKKIMHFYYYSDDVLSCTFLHLTYFFQYPLSVLPLILVALPDQKTDYQQIMLIGEIGEKYEKVFKMSEKLLLIRTCNLI